MIPMSGITAGGNNGEINTSALTRQRWKTGQSTKCHSLMQPVSQLPTLLPGPEQHPSGPW